MVLTRDRVVGSVMLSVEREHWSVNSTEKVNILKTVPVYKHSCIKWLKKSLKWRKSRECEIPHDVSFDYFLFLLDDLSYSKIATQSTTAEGDFSNANNAVDRNTKTCMRTLDIGTRSVQKTVWWKVDLGGVYNIYSINILFLNYSSFCMSFILFIVTKLIYMFIYGHNQIQTKTPTADQTIPPPRKQKKIK